MIIVLMVGGVWLMRMMMMMILFHQVQQVQVTIIIIISWCLEMGKVVGLCLALFGNSIIAILVMGREEGFEKEGLQR